MQALHRWFALAVVSMGLFGCGGGGIEEGAPPPTTGYVEPDAVSAEEPAAAKKAP